MKLHLRHLAILTIAAFSSVAFAQDEELDNILVTASRAPIDSASVGICTSFGHQAADCSVSRNCLTLSPPLAVSTSTASSVGQLGGFIVHSASR